MSRAASPTINRDPAGILPPAGVARASDVAGVPTSGVLDRAPRTAGSSSALGATDPAAGAHHGHPEDGPTIRIRQLPGQSVEVRLDAQLALGSELRALREAAGVSISAAASATGFASRRRIDAIEAGDPTRASRLRPILTLCGLDAEAAATFLARHAAGLAPESRFVQRPRVAKPVREPRPVPPPPSADQVASDSAAIGAELWRTRVRLGLERRGVARVAGIGLVHLWRIERGHRRVRLSTLWRICVALDDPMLAWRLQRKYGPAVVLDTLHAPPELSPGAPTQKRHHLEVK